jgi:hypothetical protein
MLTSLSQQYDIEWAHIEIAEDAHLLERYEVKIPVIRNLESHVEIAWPFSRQDIKDSFLTQ